MPLSIAERKWRLPHGALTRIAARTGFSLCYVSQVVRGTRSNPRIQRAVARELGLPLEEVFPSRPPRTDANAA